MKTLLLAAALSLVIAGKAASQPRLCLDTVHVNPDSTYIDTCQSSATYGRMFCRNEYTLRFDWYVISTPNYGYDTVIVYHWQDIDTQFTAIRAAFAKLEDSVGHFTLTKRLAIISDTGSRLSHSFILRFDSLMNVNTALNLLSQVPNMTAVFNGMPRSKCSDKGLTPGIDLSSITLDGSTMFTKYLHPLGWQWSIYKVKCPMAWEITRGKPSIHIIGYDDFGDYSGVSSNPDLVPNFLQNVGGTPGAGQQFLGTGAPTSTLGNGGDGHGIETLSQAIASGAHAMLGSCPNCTGMALDDAQSGQAKPDEVDVDGTSTNNWITVPEVEWNSTSGLDNGDFTRMMGEGIAIFSAGGNDMSYKEAISSNKLDYPQILGGLGYAAFISGGNNPAKDVHPLAVEGTMDGIQYGPTVVSLCTPGDTSLYPPGNQGTLIRCEGPEQFRPGFDFSCGLDKFSTLSGSDANNATRVERKTWAFVDVVAPGTWQLCAYPTKPGYTPFGGSSLSAPLVAGIAGLMRSIDYYVGAPLTTYPSGPSPRPSDPADIQRNINNIITFTADKILDYDNTAYFPEGPPYPGETEAQMFPSDPKDKVYTALTSNPLENPNATDQVILDQQAAGKPWQYDYVYQGPNDPLNRSWAQRVGFGRVNAYRAVANTIPCIGAYAYSSSQTLDYSTATTNENGAYLMHFGAWKDATEKTLDVGGNIIPYQTPPWLHYNQGQTMINGPHGVPTILKVGDNPTTGNKDILAIDGNLIGDGNSANEITTTSNGKILITGYLQDVSIISTAQGPVKIDDLIINSFGSVGWSNITVNSDAGDPSEIYGGVQLQGYGKINVNGNLTIQPGGEIDMDGNHDFEITSGTVTMDASSKIASSTRQVIVDNGANLVISGLLPVDILCNLLVRDGGKVTINTGAFLRLDEFRVNLGGTFICQSGGRLTLNKAVYNECWGNFDFEGSSAQGGRVTLTGGVSTCGTVEQRAGILCNGNIFDPLNQGNAMLTMQYVDDSDVFIFANYVPKNVFLADYFSTNTTFQDGLGCGPAILTMWNYFGGPPSINWADVMDCRFFDEAGALPSHGFYEGLYSIGLNSLYVIGSSFYNLTTGAENWGCPRLLYSWNTFGINADPPQGGSNIGPMVYGILDHASGSKYCSNSINNCVLGITSYYNTYGSLFDNTIIGFTLPGYLPTLSCLFTLSGGRFDLRNNNFSAYRVYGGYSVGAGNVISMQDINGHEYGRNSLLAGAPLTITLMTADLARYSGGGLAIACGLNTFGPSSIDHLANLDAGPIPTIEVQSNNFEAGGVVRTYQFTPTGAPTNLSGGTTTGCGDRTDVNPPACTHSIPCPDPYPSTAEWFTEDSSGQNLRTYFWNASSMLLATTLDPDCRRSKARDEIWAASLIDSASTYLPIALSNINTVLADPSATSDLKVSLWMMKAQVSEMLQMKDSAIACYDTVLASYHGYSDSIFAKEGLQWLAIPTDSITPSTDSAIFAFEQREDSDLIALVDTISIGGARKIATQESIAADTGLSITVHPNPSRNYARICVPDLPAGTPVTLIVVNEAGEIVATLYNATPDAELGLCCTLDCSKLPDGTYFARLWNDILGQSVKLSVEH